MENLYIQASNKYNTPLIDFKTNGELIIEGKSIPENAMEFYNPVINWIKLLQEPFPPTITLTIKLDYFNTSTSKIILNIIKLFERVQESSTSNITIVWKYSLEDTDMFEAGSCFQSITKVPFHLTPMANESTISRS